MKTYKWQDSRTEHSSKVCCKDLKTAYDFATKGTEDNCKWKYKLFGYRNKDFNEIDKSIKYIKDNCSMHLI